MAYIGRMKHAIALTVSLGLAAAPALAQEPEGGPQDMEEGFSLLEEGTRLLLRGLMSEMEPALRELQGALQNLDAYHAPEVLPNGDILIRRKEPREPGPEAAPEPGPGGEIDL
jgi:hypothetical protein